MSGISIVDPDVASIRIVDDEDIQQYINAKMSGRRATRMSIAARIFADSSAGWNILRIGSRLGLGCCLPQQPAPEDQDGGGAQGKPGGAPERREHTKKLSPRQLRLIQVC
ncbi:hypothetical protein DL766_001415 [Monosporascus sp. MC13-8B]|uniref:Uncharacterized protein n=1 Tax=Monosporascus cannonballus TaxID=155416 RepID=A0ABY0H4F1_9PEZI|nr:hypothetical protein DL762_005970 [Monosporascus cannonballus]RYO90474.1 hypothetical protein DL763_005323 [Monosporascus cannonballus]RYP37674.1 hypothetical protein DL766_001415 [Monosporascus sp. MC13-8B]